MAESDSKLREDAQARRTDWEGEDSTLDALRRRLALGVVENARQGTTALAPEVLHEDVSFYLDPEIYAREEQRIFREMPVVACLSNQLPEPGSFLTFDDTGVPMLITRGRDGKVRAFVNVCLHRGARVVREACGKANRFTCRFHGWTYSNEGNAIGVPQEEYFNGEIDGNKHLQQCPAEERHGFVFVKATPNSTMDLDSHLGDFGAELERLDLGNAIPVYLDDFPIEANWKFAMDTFFETYHLNALHRETFKGFFSPICVYDTFGPHHRFTFAPLCLDEWVRTPESEWNVGLLPLQYFLFPNLIMAVGSTSTTGTAINIHRIFPKSKDFFVSKMAYCAHGGVRSPEHQADIDKAYAVTRVAILDDDYSVTSEGHPGLKGLAPGSTFAIGRQEVGVQHFHRNIRRVTG